MKRVTITPEALAELNLVPRVIRPRIENVIARLARWPDISGVKALRGNRTGEYRIRTGDYRVIFIIILPDEVRIVKIGNRRDVYED